MKAPRVAFLGAKEIGAKCLADLIEWQAEGTCEIMAVFSNSRGQSIRALAEENKLDFHEELDPLLSLSDLDYLISVQYHRILRAKHLSQAKVLAVNLHMAPLPEYRGCNQFSFAILNGDDEFGTTLHVMDEGVDSGDILAERRFEIPQDCFVTELHSLTVQHSKELFESKMPGILRGEYDRTPQTDFERSRKSEFHKRAEIDSLKEIDLGWSEEKIIRHLRATSMPGFDPPYAYVCGRKLEMSIGQ